MRNIEENCRILDEAINQIAEDGNTSEVLGIVSSRLVLILVKIKGLGESAEQEAFDWIEKGIKPRLKVTFEKRRMNKPQTERKTMRSDVLDAQVELIADPLIRQWTKDTLEKAPDYFYEAPASSTGKYHPACTLGQGGLIVHTKRVVHIANRLCGGMGIEGIEKDMVISASILHDIAKTGKGSGSYMDYVNHPINGINFSAPADSSPLQESVPQIWEMVKHHMSLWTPDEHKKPIKDYTLMELCVANSDYLATTKDLITPVDE